MSKHAKPGHDALDAEERALADRLARIAPHGEPSAATDARILALATGTASATRAPRRRPARWPVWLGVAASLVVVAGIGWQLEPLLQRGQRVVYEAPATVAADDRDGQRQPIDYLPADSADNATTALPPPPPPPPEPVAPRSAQPRAARQAAVERAAAPASEATAQAARTPTADAVVASPRQAPAVAAELPGAPPIPLPDAPVAPAASAAAARTAAQGQSTAAKPATTVAAERTAVEPAATQAASESRMATPAPRAAARPALSAAEATPKADTSDAFDERPPLSATAPTVHKAWLERIRTLRDEGRIEEARASMREFVQRNPRVEVPEDLKPLLAEPGPKPEP
ncbi:hypothetical protein [Luteimonas sp. e5]